MLQSNSPQVGIPFHSLTPTSTPVEHTFLRHLGNLSPAQRRLFSLPSSSQDCLASIRQNHGTRAYEELLEALQPLIEPLNRLEASIAVLVQMQAGIISPVWGPVRALITVSDSFHFDSEKLSIFRDNAKWKCSFSCLSLSSLANVWTSCKIWLSCSIVLSIPLSIWRILKLSTPATSYFKLQ